MRKRLLSAMIALVALCVFCQPAAAASPHALSSTGSVKPGKISSQPPSTIDQSSIYRVVNGKMTHVSYQEYLQMDKQSKFVKQQLAAFAKTPSVQPQKLVMPASTYNGYSFSKQNEWTWFADEQRVSVDVVGSNTNSSITVSSSVLVMDTWSISVNIDILKVFSLDASHSITHSLNSATGYTMSLVNGRTGHIVFRPALFTLSGILTYPSGNQTFVTGNVPLSQGNGDLDGWYYIVYSGNLAANNSFEAGQDSWGDWHPGGQASAQKVDGDWPHTGYKKLTHWAPFGYSETTYQVITDLPPGTYRATVWVRSSGGQSHVRLEANQFNQQDPGQTITVDINNKVWSDWGWMAILNIPVTADHISIGLHSDASAGQWAAWDDVQLSRDGQ